MVEPPQAEICVACNMQIATNFLNGSLEPFPGRMGNRTTAIGPIPAGQLELVIDRWRSG